MTQTSLSAAIRSRVVRSPADLCLFVDELGADATGEVLFEARAGAPDGAVFVECGRVCWAAARGLAPRLGDLLAASARTDPAGMERLYRECQRQRVPLGEYLVRNGFVTPTDLRATLLRHAAESLRTLCAGTTTAMWSARRGGGYSPRFTFTTPELLARTFAEMHGAVVEAAADELGQVLGEDDWGAAYIRSGARAAPDLVCVHGVAPDRVSALVALGRWATSSLDVAALLHDEDAFLATVFDDSALVAWRSNRVLFAASTAPHGPARMLNRRASARLRGTRHGGV